MRVLSFPDLRERKGITWSWQHIHRLMNERGDDGKPKFPRPMKLGKATNAWLEDEIDNWISERLAERDGSPFVAFKTSEPDEAA
jgi:predicted DNA-binding transcriptional regulator AlpA